MAKSHLQGHQGALLNFGPSSYASYNSWRSNLTDFFYARGSNVIFFINQCNKRKPSDRFTQARVYLYDLYYHLPNSGLGKVLNSHDVHLVAFQNLPKCQFPPPLHSNLKIMSWISPSLRADNPTHPLLNPPFFPWFAQGPTPGACLWHVHYAHH